MASLTFQTAQLRLWFSSNTSKFLAFRWKFSVWGRCGWSSDTLPPALQGQVFSLASSLLSHPHFWTRISNNSDNHHRRVIIFFRLGVKPLIALEYMELMETGCSKVGVQKAMAEPSRGSSWRERKWNLFQGMACLGERAGNKYNWNLQRFCGPEFGERIMAC